MYLWFVFLAAHDHTVRSFRRLFMQYLCVVICQVLVLSHFDDNQEFYDHMTFFIFYKVKHNHGVNVLI